MPRADSRPAKGQSPISASVRRRIPHYTSRYPLGVARAVRTKRKFLAPTSRRAYPVFPPGWRSSSPSGPRREHHRPIGLRYSENPFGNGETSLREPGMWATAHEASAEFAHGGITPPVLRRPNRFAARIRRLRSSPMRLPSVCVTLSVSSPARSGASPRRPALRGRAPPRWRPLSAGPVF